jgi:hypothetical protein
VILGEDKMTFDHVKGVQCRMKWNIAGMESNIEQLLDSVRPSMVEGLQHVGHSCMCTELGHLTLAFICTCS